MRPILLLLAVLLFSACSFLGSDGDDAGDFEDVYAYTGYGDGREVVVTGTLRLVLLPSDVADEPSRIQGQWVLEARAGGVGPQDGEGDLEGTYEGEEFVINLNPGRADDNVFLNGRFEEDGERLEGTWSHVTLLGTVATGPFEAEQTHRARRRYVAG